MNNLYKRIKSELALIPSSDKNTNYSKFIEEVNEIIKKYPEDSVKIGLDLMLDSCNWKPWSSICLSDINFDVLNRHYRAWYIQKDNKGIYNVLAYMLKERKTYQEIDNQLVEKSTSFAEGEIIDERIYISRGGIINGDYVYKCYLKHQPEFYNIKDPVKIPIGTIWHGLVDFICYVDHREPKLKALMEFYDVPIEHDDYIKFNLRTAKKLK